MVTEKRDYVVDLQKLRITKKKKIQNKSYQCNNNIIIIIIYFTEKPQNSPF